MTSVLRRIPPFLHTAFLFCIWQNMGISVVFFLRFLLYQSSFFSFLSIYLPLHIYFIISLLYSPPFSKLSSYSSLTKASLLLLLYTAFKFNLLYPHCGPIIIILSLILKLVAYDLYVRRPHSHKIYLVKNSKIPLL